MTNEYFSDKVKEINSSMNPEELFEKAQHITISLPPYPSKEEFESACLFFSAAKKLGKDASLQGANLNSPLKEPLQGKTFTVSLRGLSDVISKIHYEKSGGDVKLYFTLRNGEISSNNIALESSQASNLILIVGNNSARDNSSEIDNTSSIQGTKDFLDTTLSLLSPFDVPGVQLLSLVLSRLQENPQKLYTAHVTRQDFVETKTTQLHLRETANEIKEYGDKTASYFILFETQKETKGILWSENSQIQKRILSQGTGSIKNNWMVCSFPQKNSEDALNNILKTLNS
ncbi:MAG: hypothetical protein KJI69_02570 [Patescibacteria group bacterium]|nr:hypothetical protein [Patescibacteria group bacterium]